MADKTIDKGNSAIPPELIPVILSNLGKEDLFNCRLVCGSWNKECLKILKASEWRVQCDHKSIQIVIDYFSELPTPEFILPLKILFGESTRFGRLIDGLNNLFSLVGDECVGSVAAGEKICLFDDGNDQIVLSYMLEVLALVSKGLTKLDLEDMELELSLVRILAVTSNQSIFLPKLKTFRSHVENPSGTLKTPAFFNHLMRSCPNLRDLRFSAVGGLNVALEGWEFPTDNLENLSIGNLNLTIPFVQKIQNTNPALKYFEYTGSESDNLLLVSFLTQVSNTLENLILETIGLDDCIIFPLMQKLKSLRYYKGKDKEYVYQNLEGVNFNSETFPALEYLELGVNLEDDFGKAEFTAERLMNFPKMRRIIIRSAWNWITWMRKNNPSSEIIKFPLNFLSSKLTARMPTVTQVIIRCNTWVARGMDDPDMQSEKHLKQNMENLRYIFPYLSKATFGFPIQESDDELIVAKSQYYSIRLLKLFLLHVSEEHLTEITLTKSSRNFLRIALKEILCPPRLSLENLEDNPGLVASLKKTWHERTLGLEDIVETSTENSAGGQGEITALQNLGKPDFGLKVFNGVKTINMMPGRAICSKDKANLDFTLIAKFFPNLTELVIPAEWFSSDETVQAEQCQNIFNLFPSVDIYKV